MANTQEDVSTRDRVLLWVIPAAAAIGIGGGSWAWLVKLSPLLAARLELVELVSLAWAVGAGSYLVALRLGKRAARDLDVEVPEADTA